MNRLGSVLTVIVFLLVAFVRQPVEAQQKGKYNVLFIAVDDMSDWIGPFGGYPGIKTPNLDKLAKKGVVF